MTEPIAYTGGPGEVMRINANNLNLELKMPEDVASEELLAFLANCKSQADAAGIPPERYSIDMAAEFAAAIDRAMGRAPELPEAEPETGETETEAETDETETTPPEDDAGEG